MPQDPIEFPFHAAPVKPLPPARIAAGVFLLALAIYVVSAVAQAVPALGSFDVASAIILGLFARQPAWRKWPSFACTAVAAALVYWATGHGLWSALNLAVADGVGILIGLYLLARLPSPTLQMRREDSPWLVLLACLAASAASTALRLPIVLGGVAGAITQTIAMDFGKGLMNHVLVVPAILCFSPHLRYRWRKSFSVLPIACLLLSELLASVIGGPGAMAFTLPAFIWCALRYGLFASSVFFAMFTVWKCNAFVIGHSSMASAYFPDVIALRTGLSLLWLGPLTVACSHAARNEVLKRLSYASQHDFLTQTLVRGTFMERSEAALARMRRNAQPMAVLMLDIDHFKHVNDEYGHGMGDTVLQGFAQTVSHLLRQSDQMGRYGGEEFCVCLPGTDLPGAILVAERLRKAVMSHAFKTPLGKHLHVTVSMGLAHFDASELPPSIEAALAHADALLYRAKTGGRNRVEHDSIRSASRSEQASGQPQPMQPA